MKTKVLRSTNTDYQRVQIPEDPFDLTGIAVDYAQLVQINFPNSVLTRMQFDVPVIASNFVTTGAGWRFTAMSTALYEVLGAICFNLTAGITYHITVGVYVNGALYRATTNNVGSVGTYPHSVQFANVIPLAKGDYVEIFCAVFSSDASATLTEALTQTNYINILRLWKTQQQSLGIASTTLPPADPGTGGGSHTHG